MYHVQGMILKMKRVAEADLEVRQTTVQESKTLIIFRERLI